MTFLPESFHIDRRHDPIGTGAKFLPRLFYVMQFQLGKPLHIEVHIYRRQWMNTRSGTHLVSQSHACHSPHAQSSVKIRIRMHHRFGTVSSIYEMGSEYAIYDEEDLWARREITWRAIHTSTVQVCNMQMTVYCMIQCLVRSARRMRTVGRRWVIIIKLSYIFLATHVGRSTELSVY